MWNRIFRWMFPMKQSITESPNGWFRALGDNFILEGVTNQSGSLELTLKNKNSQFKIKVSKEVADKIATWMSKYYATGNNPDGGNSGGDNRKNTEGLAKVVSISRSKTDPGSGPRPA